MRLLKFKTMLCDITSATLFLKWPTFGVQTLPALFVINLSTNQATLAFFGVCVPDYFLSIERILKVEAPTHELFLPELMT